MNKFLSLLICIGFLVSVNAQNSPFIMSKEELRIKQMPSKTDKPQQKKQLLPLPKIPAPDRKVDIVDIIDIGTSANAFTYWRNLSYVWVDPTLNTIINIHRMGGELDPGGFSGDLGYDISTDGGSTWTNMVEIFQSYLIGYWWVSARYPQAGIYNPGGNTNPDDAYVSYFAPVTDTSDQLWSYMHGVGNIGDTSYHTLSIIESDEKFYQNTTSGFDITSNDQIFVIDENTNNTGDIPEYRDSLIITKGIWDDDVEDFIYERENLEALVTEESMIPVDYKVAFGPDGQTGYIVMIADNGEAEQIEGFKNFYPIFWKTTDAGETWSGPEVIQLDGPNGLDNLVYNFLTDSQIEELFTPPVPSRENISYTTAYDLDIVADKDDNLHIAVVMGPTGSDPYSIITASGYFAAFNIITSDGGESWFSREMGRLRTFRGYFDDISSDNRIQITLNPDGDKSFTSWLDTDLEEVEENNRPNIWCRGYDFAWDCLTMNSSGEDAPNNVTNFSAGMWEAFFASAPKTSFEFAEGEYTIPYVYTDMDPNEFGPVQFKYIQNFSFNDADFCPEGIVDLNLDNAKLKVIGNFPNPFINETTIQIELYKTEKISLTISSITGQQLIEQDYGLLNQGKQDLILQVNNLSPGIYFYTISAESERVTKKMVVE